MVRKPHRPFCHRCSVAPNQTQLVAPVKKSGNKYEASIVGFFIHRDPTSRASRRLQKMYWAATWDNVRANKDQGAF